MKTLTPASFQYCPEIKDYAHPQSKSGIHLSQNKGHFPLPRMMGPEIRYHVRFSIWERWGENGNGPLYGILRTTRDDLRI